MMKLTGTSLLSGWWKEKFERGLPDDLSTSRFDLLERLKERRVAVLVIDVQERLMRRVDPVVPVPDQEKMGLEHFYSQIEKTTEALRKAGATILHIACGEPSEPNAWQVLPAHQRPGYLKNGDLRLCYAVDDQDHLYIKMQNSAFDPSSSSGAHNPDLLLKKFLKERNIDTLLLLGIHGDSCIRATAIDARKDFDLGFIGDLIQNNRFNNAGGELCRRGVIEGGYSLFGPVFQSNDIVEAIHCKRPITTINGSRPWLLTPPDHHSSFRPE